MAYMFVPKKEEELKKMTAPNIRKDYMKLAETYSDMLEGKKCYCPRCDGWISSANFYLDKKSADNIQHWGCKKCIFKACTDYNKADDSYKDNKDKMKKMCQILDLPFLEKVYDDQVQASIDSLGEKNRSTGSQQYLVMLASLPQYRNKTFDDSEWNLDSDSNPEYEQKEIKKVINAGKKRFGSDYSNQDLMFLENEYQDWVTRYECNTKAQEEIFKNLSTNRLERKQAVKDGKPTKEIDKTFQELLATQNIQPRQTGMDTLADAQTFGTLIQKYEETRPLPEIDESLKDVDKIGLYLDTFYKANILKCLDLKNPLHHLYEKIMKIFSVDKPEVLEDEDTSTLFDFIFGKEEE